MINYIEKGIELHQEIARQGYKLYELDGVWVADNEEVVQNIIDTFVTFTPESIANWDSFNLAMITDADFNQVYNQCLAIAPLIANALPSALTQVAEGKLSMFDLIFNQICQIGNANSTMREVWGGYAQTNNLPTGFVNIINPSI